MPQYFEQIIGHERFEQKSIGPTANTLFSHIEPGSHDYAQISQIFIAPNRLKNFHAAILVQEINVQKVQRKTGPDLVVNVILAALMEKGEKAEKGS